MALNEIYLAFMALPVKKAPDPCSKACVVVILISTTRG